jgi:amino acid adenylation domain-containing protein
MVRVQVDTRLTRALKELAAEQQVTLFMLCLAAYAILLAKITGQQDIVMGTPVSGRTHVNVTQLVGIFVNTLALRINTEPTLTFYQYLETVKQQTLAALENQEYPFERLVEKLNLSGDAGQNPIFNTMFALVHVYEQQISIKNDRLKFIPYDIQIVDSMFDLLLGISVTESNIHLNFTYNIHLFHEDTIQRWADYYTTILSWVVNAPGQPIGKIDTSVPMPLKTTAPAFSDNMKIQNNLPAETPLPLETIPVPKTLTQEQKQWILYEFNQTRMEYPQDMTIHQLFECQTRNTSTWIAVTGENRQLSCGELSKKAHQVAARLKEKGLTTASCVGLMVESSVEMMIGILGILKAGGCYLPLDPQYPEEHHRYLMADASISFVLTQHRFKTLYPAKYAAHVIFLDIPGTREEPATLTLTSAWNVPAANPAYVIYTSGSTGRPKGTIVEHQAVVNRLTWMQKNYPLTPVDIFLQKTTFTFDVSVIEFFSWFMGGARLCFLEPDADTDLQKILDTIETRNITALSFTPTVLHTFFLSLGKKDIEKLASLKWIFCAGEQLPLNLVETWGSFGPEARLENLYGPTEATVYASYYSCHPQFCPAPVPIGKPLGNTRLYILDEHRQLMPPGAIGELVLAGASLARGYLNRPELTIEKFLPDPFFPGDKMYCTGDYARLLPDGQVVYLGRMDNQVKIKGIRVELEEIESVLLKHPDIREAAVIDRDDPMGKYLAAYIVSQGTLSLKELRDYLLRKLPEYMVPAAFSQVQHMPLTTSGKLDRKLLPQLGTPLKTGRQYTAPRNQLERQLTQAWAKILKLDKIGIDDNFFEMGGDSLRGNLLLAQINNQFKTETVIKDLFSAPTIRKFTGILSRSKAKEYNPITPGEKKDYYPTSTAQKRLYIIHQLNKDDTAYNLSTGMIIEGQLDKSRLNHTVKHLVQRHDSLRTRFEIRDGEIIQRIEDHTDFEVEFFAGEGWDEKDLDKIIKGDIQLGKSPTGAVDKYVFIEPLEKKEYYEQSSAQKRLFFLQRFEQITTSYNIPGINRVEGKLDISAFEKAFQDLIRRHNTLRTSLEFIDETPVQRIHQQVNFKLQVLQKENKEIHELFDAFVQPFDLTQPPLLRVALIKLSTTEYLLFHDIHHIISDGTSIGILIEDVVRLYSKEKLQPLKVQYKDFSLWQNSLYETGKIKKQMDYWLKLFSGEIPILDLPTDYPRPPRLAFEGDYFTVYLEPGETEKLLTLCEEMRATLYMNLLAVLNVLLFKYTGLEDIIVGSGLMGRPQEALQKIIGMFVNFLAMRNYPKGNKTYWQFFKEVKEHTLDAFENQDVQFEELVQQLNLERDPSRNPLFDVTFVVQNFERPTLRVPELSMTPYEMENKTSKFDLTLFTEERENRLFFYFEYAAQLFEKKTIEKIANHFIEIIKQVNRDKHIFLKEISISKDLLDAQVGSLENEEGDFQL